VRHKCHVVGVSLYDFPITSVASAQYVFGSAAAYSDDALSNSSNDYFRQGFSRCSCVTISLLGIWIIHSHTPLVDNYDLPLNESEHRHLLNYVSSRQPRTSLRGTSFAEIE
jgi:hypothetical protein